MADVIRFSGYAFYDDFQIADNGIDDIAECSCLFAGAVNMERFIAFDAGCEIGEYAVVSFLHAGAVYVEGPDDVCVGIELGVIDVAEGFTCPFTFVVTGARTQAGDVSSVGFRGGDVFWIGVSVNFRA